MSSDVDRLSKGGVASNTPAPVPLCAQNQNFFSDLRVVSLVPSVPSGFGLLLMPTQGVNPLFKSCSLALVTVKC